MCKNMNEIKVSVICITYNHEKYIKDALESFIKQKTKFKFEVIIHDDASTDRTQDIIQDYVNLYPDIFKPIFQSDNQLSKDVDICYHYILPMAKGEYIALCEGDDYWTDPLKLQKQYDYMICHPDCSLCVHNTIRLNMKSGIKKAFISKNEYSKKAEFCSEDIILNHILFHTSSLFFRKDFYNKNEDFLTCHKRFDYLIKCLLATEGNIHYIPNIMSVYRMGTSGSWTKRVYGNSEKYIEHNIVAIKTMEDLNKYRLYKYNDCIQRNILSRKFNILLRQNQYSTIMKDPFLCIYKNLSLKRKIYIRVKQVFSCLYNIFFSKGKKK